MSTTLMPPTYYVVRPQGLPAYIYETVREAAGALHELAPTAAAVYVTTGRKRRSLSEHELRQFGRHLRARRLATATSGVAEVSALSAVSGRHRAAAAAGTTPTPRRPRSAAVARAARAPTLKLPPFLDNAAVEAGLEAGLHKERRRFAGRAVAA
ncbi:MAG: hypothetical protein ABSD82_12025 [Solirubrobacteraceae bacterium]|jgi:hypothetical protein